MKSTIITTTREGNQGGYVMDHNAPVDMVTYLKNHPSVYEITIQFHDDEEGWCHFSLNRDQVKPEYL